jgi:putative transposase
MYHGYRFLPEIISHAIWLYHRFCLSYRDVEDLLVERGIVVSYESICSWCNKLGPAYARSIKRFSRVSVPVNFLISRVSVPVNYPSLVTFQTIRSLAIVRGSS